MPDLTLLYGEHRSANHLGELISAQAAGLVTD